MALCRYGNMSGGLAATGDVDSVSLYLPPMLSSRWVHETVNTRYSPRRFMCPAQGRITNLGGERCVALALLVAVFAIRFLQAQQCDVLCASPRPQFDAEGKQTGLLLVVPVALLCRHFPEENSPFRQWYWSS